MSGSIELKIVTSADWAVQITWLDGNGIPVLFSDPVMDIRQEQTSTGNLIARLDGSGLLDGSITIPEIGTLILSMPAAKTAALQTGYGHWDLFVIVNNSRVRFAFGTVSIQPHVTVL